MPKDPGQPQTRTRPLTRRTLLQREGQGPSLVSQLLAAPNVGWALLISIAFVAVCAVLSSWARQNPLVAVGRVMTDTRLVRIGFTQIDHDQTRQKREQARQTTPRVYRVNESVLAAVHNSIANLPHTLATVENPEQLTPEVARQFTITPEALAAIKPDATEDGVSERWAQRAERFTALLREVPLLDPQTYQNEANSGLNTEVELISDSGASRLISGKVPQNIKDEATLRDMVAAIARRAGFNEPALGVVVSRVLNDPQPTYQFDEALTAERQNRNANAVEPVPAPMAVDQVIYKRGDVLSRSQFDLYEKELAEYLAQGERWRIWVRRAGLTGAIGVITLAGAGYVGLFCPRVRRNPGRMAGVAGIAAGALAVACAASVANPGLMPTTATAPTAFLAAILVVAYDRRVALALGALHAVLVCLSLDLPVGMLAVMLTGVGVGVWQLHEVRDRRTVVRAGVLSGVGMALVTMLAALIDRPLIPDARAMLVQAVYDSLWTGAGGVLNGAVLLAILPSVEKWFDITTGLTLIEKRDPKQPLLRELQQRAPGTYNHSLNVASISEAAAEAIGADGLLTYVGSLYHDIGKMNKPDYFVENHSGGPSKHDRLSPAMSLLVIVGHVKDGTALAEEYALPRSLRHFIEAHHGTTLVEFFYSRARQQAEKQQDEGEEAEAPAEIEYRYPGPKPRTKEVAIVMIADAVESATRTMVEPTPSRIDALVRAIANKRLMDGQFDECDLTLRELQTIAESISKSVASIYHGRVQYASTAALASGEARAEEKRA
ncbi:MAG: HD family phosphohydrolase [Phycisphaerales bacterium]